MKALDFDPKSTAFIIIDLQKAIAGGRRELGPHSAQKVVENCASLANSLRKSGATMFYVHVDMKNFIQLNADQPSRDPKAPAPPPSASEFVDDCGKMPEDFVITKRHWSAFPGTPLEKDLRNKGIKTVIIGGIATNFGVESTARDAAGLGFNLIFAEDAMTSVTAEAHRFATELIFPRLGRVRSSAEILAALH